MAGATRALRGTAKLRLRTRRAELRVRCQFCRRILADVFLEGEGEHRWVELVGAPPANVTLEQPFASFSTSRRSLRWRHTCNGRKARTVQRRCDELVGSYEKARALGLDLFL